MSEKIVNNTKNIVYNVYGFFFSKERRDNVKNLSLDRLKQILHNDFMLKIEDSLKNVAKINLVNESIIDKRMKEIVANMNKKFTYLTFFDTKIDTFYKDSKEQNDILGLEKLSNDVNVNALVRGVIIKKIYDTHSYYVKRLGTKTKIQKMLFDKLTYAYDNSIDMLYDVTNEHHRNIKKYILALNCEICLEVRRYLKTEKYFYVNHIERKIVPYMYFIMYNTFEKKQNYDSVCDNTGVEVKIAHDNNGKEKAKIYNKIYYEISKMLDILLFPKIGLLMSDNKRSFFRISYDDVGGHIYIGSANNGYGNHISMLKHIDGIHLSRVYCVECQSKSMLYDLSIDDFGVMCELFLSKNMNKERPYILKNSDQIYVQHEDNFMCIIPYDKKCYTMSRKATENFCAMYEKIQTIDNELKDNVYYKEFKDLSFHHSGDENTENDFYIMYNYIMHLKNNDYSKYVDKFSITDIDNLVTDIVRNIPPKNTDGDDNGDGDEEDVEGDVDVDVNKNNNNNNDNNDYNDNDDNNDNDAENIQSKSKVLNTKNVMDAILLAKYLANNSKRVCKKAIINNEGVKMLIFDILMCHIDNVDNVCDQKVCINIKYCLEKSKTCRNAYDCNDVFCLMKYTMIKMLFDKQNKYIASPLRSKNVIDKAAAAIVDNVYNIINETLTGFLKRIANIYMNKFNVQVLKLDANKSNELLDESYKNGVVNKCIESCDKSIQTHIKNLPEECKENMKNFYNDNFMNVMRKIMENICSNISNHMKTNDKECSRIEILANKFVNVNVVKNMMMPYFEYMSELLMDTIYNKIQNKFILTLILKKYTEICKKHGKKLSFYDFLKETETFDKRIYYNTKDFKPTRTSIYDIMKHNNNSKKGIFISDPRKNNDGYSSDENNSENNSDNDSDNNENDPVKKSKTAYRNTRLDLGNGLYGVIKSIMKGCGMTFDTFYENVSGFENVYDMNARVVMYSYNILAFTHDNICPIRFLYDNVYNKRLEDIHNNKETENANNKLFEECKIRKENNKTQANSITDKNNIYHELLDIFDSCKFLNGKLNKFKSYFYVSLKDRIIYIGCDCSDMDDVNKITKNHIEITQYTTNYHCNGNVYSFIVPDMKMLYCMMYVRTHVKVVEDVYESDKFLFPDEVRFPFVYLYYEHLNNYTIPEICKQTRFISTDITNFFKTISKNEKIKIIHKFNDNGKFIVYYNNGLPTGTSVF